MYENNNTMKRLFTFKITVVTVVVSVVVAVVVIVPHATSRSPFHRSVFFVPFPLLLVTSSFFLSPSSCLMPFFHSFSADFPSIAIGFAVLFSAVFTVPFTIAFAFAVAFAVAFVVAFDVVVLVVVVVVVCGR